MGFSVKGAVGGGLVGGSVGALAGGTLLKSRPGAKNPYDDFNFQLPSLADQEMNPMVKRYQDQLSQAQSQGPKQLSAESLQSAAQQVATPMPEYDAIRARVQSQAQAQGQQNLEGIRRKFASMGTINSGAALKQEQITQDNSAKQGQDAMAGVDFQEAQARRALSSEVNNRNFQREQFNADASFKDKVFNLESTAKLAQLDLAFKDAEYQREMDRYTLELNRLGLQQANKPKQGLVGGLFGEGGVPILRDAPVVGGLFR